NFEGEEKDKMNEFVRLMLKDIRTVSDRKKLMAMLDEVLAGSDADSSTVYNYLQMMSKDMKLQLLSAIITAVESGGEIDVPTEDEIKDTVDKGNQNTQKPQKPEKQEPQYSDSTYEENLEILGVANLDSPSTITIYPLNFEAKSRVTEIIDEYNKQQTDEGKEDNVISYTDYVSLIMSSVTQVIDLVTYALVAFVAISLVVSSIMIGIITYISVLERTKEIGILRSIGASKRDISRVFNCETIIVGLVSGVMGILLSLLLIIPINAIINSVANIPHLAQLPLYGGLTLIAISVVLTVVAGLIPAKVAAKKDPVIALRSE
ncbi:MAG: ABC transporter permease, partial [Clostridia bacterium]|nr:ABC transporter permease [Clostridia bacterium]